MPEITVHLLTICGDSYEASILSRQPRPRDDTVEKVHQYMCFAKNIMVDATGSLIYVCGIAPLDSEDPSLYIFQCDLDLK